MGVNAEIEYPVIEFRSSDLKPGTDAWNRLCKRVREACETFGSFEVVYEKISTKVRDEVFRLIKELVEVPVERKQKNVSPMPFHGWVGSCPQISLLYEGFGVGDASNYDSVKSFAQLMWPDGYPHFCYGLGEESLKMSYTTLIRMVKYMAPPSGKFESGLFPHTDKPISTLICEDKISGLEIEVKDGQWLRLSNLSPSSFVFMVGDPFKAWSNGRLKSGMHKVMISGDKDRYSIAAFAVPNKGTIIKTPKELIDDQHPQLYKDFDFMEYFFFTASDLAKTFNSNQQIDGFAALSPPISN